MTLEEKIELVKSSLLEKKPGVTYTIIIKIWDDGTDWVEARHGDDTGKLSQAIYYNNELKFVEDKEISYYNFLDRTGKEHKILFGEVYDVLIVNKEEFISKKDELLEIANLEQSQFKTHALDLLDLINQVETNNSEEKEVGISFGKYSYDIIETVSLLNHLGIKPYKQQNLCG